MSKFGADETPYTANSTISATRSKGFCMHILRTSNACFANPLDWTLEARYTQNADAHSGQSLRLAYAEEGQAHVTRKVKHFLHEERTENIVAVIDSGLKCSHTT